MATFTKIKKCTLCTVCSGCNFFFSNRVMPNNSCVCERVRVQRRGRVHMCANGKLNHGASSSSLPCELPRRTVVSQKLHRCPARLFGCGLIVWDLWVPPVEYQIKIWLLFCCHLFLKSLTVKDLTDVISVSSQRHTWIFIWIFLQLLINYSNSHHKLYFQ